MEPDQDMSDSGQSRARTKTDQDMSDSGQSRTRTKTDQEMSDSGQSRARRKTDRTCQTVPVLVSTCVVWFSSPPPRFIQANNLAITWK